MARILRQDAERLLANVPEDHVFWCHDGRIMKNMRELRDALASMSQETFSYHSNQEKNDFSNWVKDVIGDTKLSSDLMRASNISQAGKAVADRVLFLASKLV